MKIIADTNLLIRAALYDDLAQAQLAEATLERAESVTVPIPALCEFAWVLRQGYRKSRAEVAAAIREILDAAKMRVDRPIVDAGIAALEAGADFADGCIDLEGRRLGGAVFATFDRRAAQALKSRGLDAMLLRVKAEP